VRVDPVAVRATRIPAVASRSVVARQSAAHPVLRMHRLAGNRALGSAQAKLTISEPGDPYEVEADRVADQVMRLPDAQVERNWACGGTCVACKNDAHGHFQRTVSRSSAVVSASPAVEEAVEDDNVIPDEMGMPKHHQQSSVTASSRATSVRVPGGAGRPLDARARRFMEQRFAYDFAGVRVHTDAKASASARRLDAFAYTVGGDIFFERGQYNPESFEGRRLLAHELTHVVQQTDGCEGLLQAKRPRRGEPPCRNTCAAGHCPQGKQSRVVVDDCGVGRPRNENNYITALHVSLADRTVKVIWSAPVPGNVEIWPCSPNPTVTPRRSPDRPDTVGKKCGIHHTNYHRDGMAWFTGFASENLRIGFHDSQPVGRGCVSHGCVRVCCDHAKTINEHTWSGRTLITVQ